MHKVKCKVCGKEFDRDKIACVLVSARRYAHKECAEKAGLQGDSVEPPKKENKNKDLEDLEIYIKNFLEEDYINPRVRKQINKYHKEYNYSYSGMLKTLIYFYDVKKNPKDKNKANGGIGIIPYVYSEACQYYYNIYLANLANEGKDLSFYKPKHKIVEIFTPIAKTKPIKFLFEGEE